MPSGKVCFFNDIIGNGFIEPDDGSEKIRVSYRSIKKAGYKILHEGQRVSFELLRTKNGLRRAVNVIPLER